MLEHQIRDGKTRNVKSGTPTFGTILLDGIAKPRIVKRGTLNLEKYLRTTQTAPLRKKYNGVACGNDKTEYKARGNDKPVRNTEEQQCYLKCYLQQTMGVV